MDDCERVRKQLMERIEELERLNRELLREDELEVKLEYAWTGNLGHWFWDVKTNTVTFNPLKVTTLGYDRGEVPDRVDYQYFTDKLHPEDLEGAMEAMRAHLYGRAAVYEAEYRIRAKDGTYRWYYDRGKITQYDSEGKPQFLAGIVFDVTERKSVETELAAKNEILANMAAMDGLTKVFNHRTLLEHLKSEIMEAQRTKRPLSIAMFDIDDFKKVNDSRGHIYGDQVLAGFAEIIRGSIRGSDFPGRYGGEEFMVVFPDTKLDGAWKISDRIRKALESHGFAEGIRVTVSGGVKQYEGGELASFVHSADLNLLEAKRKGKNVIVG